MKKILAKNFGFVLVMIAFLSTAALADADPFDPASCQGGSLDNGTIRSFFASGATSANFGSSKISYRSRSCNPMTGCTTWVNGNGQDLLVDYYFCDASNKCDLRLSRFGDGPLNLTLRISGNKFVWSVGSSWNSPNFGQHDGTVSSQTLSTDPVSQTVVLNDNEEFQYWDVSLATNRFVDSGHTVSDLNEDLATAAAGPQTSKLYVDEVFGHQQPVALTGSIRQHCLRFSEHLVSARDANGVWTEGDCVLFSQF